MATTINDILRGLISPALCDSAAERLGEHETGIKRGMEGAMLAILGGLLRRSDNNETMADVAALVADPAGASGNRDAGYAGTPRTDLGDRLLAAVFGANTEPLTTAVARASGIGQPSQVTLFGAAAPLVLAVLGKKLGPNAATPTALASLLHAETTPILKAVPPYMHPLLGLDKVRDRAGQMAAAASQLSIGSLLLTVPLALLAALLIWYLMALVAGPEEKHAARVTSGKATTTQTEIDDAEARRLAAARETKAALERRETVETKRQPPPPGLIRWLLTDGVEIEIAPLGIESKLISFVEDSRTPIDKTRWFDFDRLNFRTGSSDLTPESRSQVRTISEVLKAYPKVRIKIGGYTDNVGDANDNLKLSDERARRVMAELIDLGIASDRLEAEGYGAEHPVADNSTAEGRARNRRIAVSVRER